MTLTEKEKKEIREMNQLEFDNMLVKAYNLMIKRGHILESGKIVLDEKNIFSYKIRKVKK